MNLMSFDVLVMELSLFKVGINSQKICIAVNGAAAKRWILIFYFDFITVLHNKLNIYRPLEIILLLLPVCILLA